MKKDVKGLLFLENKKKIYNVRKTEILSCFLIFGKNKSLLTSVFMFLRVCDTLLYKSNLVYMVVFPQFLIFQQNNSA